MLIHLHRMLAVWTDDGLTDQICPYVCVIRPTREQADALDLDLTVDETITRASTTESYNQLRALMAQFMFKGDAIFKKVRFCGRVDVGWLEGWGSKIDGDRRSTYAVVCVDLPPGWMMHPDTIGGAALGRGEGPRGAVQDDAQARQPSVPRRGKLFNARAKLERT